MEIEEFKGKHKSLSVELHVDVDYDEDENGEEVETKTTYYILKNLPHLDGITVKAVASDLQRLDSIIGTKPELLKEILGAKINGRYEVVLRRIAQSGMPTGSGVYALRDKPLRISTQYRGKSVNIQIVSQGESNTDMEFIAERMVGNLYAFRGQIVAVVEGLIDSQKSESELRTILRSVLFDVGVTYSLNLEAARLDVMKPSGKGFRPKRVELPQEEFNLVVKPYIPELVEYYHTAIRVDYAPFKFVCYFHILEYFMDKSAHRSISRRIKQIMMRPDFHAKHSDHINEAIKAFRTETERNLTDKVKINRVISEYVRRDETRAFIQNEGLLDHFEKDNILSGPRPIKISPISFESDSSFYESLAKRVYTFRCSIVHSNPEFDESKAVPFHPNAANIDFLRVENRLMREIAGKVIVNSID